MHEPATAVGQGGCSCLSDSGQDAGKIGVILERDEPIEREESQRRVLTRLVAAFTVRSPTAVATLHPSLLPYASLSSLDEDGLLHMSG